MEIGYVRGLASHPGLSMQIDTLKKFGCERIFKDKQDSYNERPAFRQMLSQLRRGDRVVVWKLDRIGKSVNDLVNLLVSFKEREVDFVSLQDNVDTSTDQGKLFLNMMASLSEFKRDNTHERTIAGLKTARKGGRPAGLSDVAIKKAKKAKQLYEDDSMPVADIAKTLGIGKTTLYRYLHYVDVDIVHRSTNGIKMSPKKIYRNEVKKELFRKLFESKAFWSYSNVRIEQISDDILIQKVMEELDIHDIKKLLLLYNLSHIKGVWKNEMVIQDPYYRSLNILLAMLLFNIKKPEFYIKKVQKEFQKSISE